MKYVHFILTSKANKNLTHIKNSSALFQSTKIRPSGSNAYETCILYIICQFQSKIHPILLPLDLNNSS